MGRLRDQRTGSTSAGNSAAWKVCTASLSRIKEAVATAARHVQRCLGDVPALRIVSAEQFGPTLIIPYDDEDGAVARANDTWSGLRSSVWSGDDHHATSVAERLRTGSRSSTTTTTTPPPSTSELG
jgi:hypothetical protein